ncbi:MAG: hybrid sensor histidine kinase/response regulator [Proteobacteria bacterium]|nr:hybrid sensor histidine kinase/response regulator [Pseudomonadota bacterium]
MDTKEAEFLQKLLAMFKVEAREHLNVISFGLTTMGEGGSARSAELVETVFREAHSLKGAARSVNLIDIVNLCQVMEEVFAALKGGRVDLSAQTCDALQQTVDYCFRLVDGEEITTADKSVIRELKSRLGDAVSEDSGREKTTEPMSAQDRQLAEEVTEKDKEGEEPFVQKPEITESLERSADLTPSLPPERQPPTSAGPVAPETVRIATSKLDALLLQAEEMISLKIAAGQRAAELRELKRSFDLWKKKRPRERLIGRTNDLHPDSPLLTDPFISSLDTRLMAMVRAAEYDQRSSAAMIDMMLDDMKKTLMLPFSSLLEMLPRVIRDLSRAAGKKVALTTEGGDIDVDRRILEEMKDPLIHLIRNCVDHGIEPVSERETKGKPADGTMKIAVSSKDNKIEIAITDDGAGIDVARIKSAAVRHSVVSQEEADKLGDQEAMHLIFHSGVTTSPLITDISGRGLGLTIVREKVEKLNGTVAVDSQIDKGTIFRIVVPLTFATFRGTLVRVAEQLFVLPSCNVECVARARRETIQTVENRETIVFEGRPISLVRLADVLQMKSAAARRMQEKGPVQIIILGFAEKRIAFVVDEVLREQEVLVKPLGGQLSRVKNISGATVLANGKVAPILNVSDLLKSVAKNSSSFAAGETTLPEKSLSILVVEDSITARALLKNILESAGYQVQTAVDGLDGLTTLKSREFDIVVTDVEMPRMNGFELTARIRSDKKFMELPVVLVTALESREDRERGIDVGASAYIVKSSFDQSNLLEVIERLI